jgi:hypothetical protein
MKMALSDKAETRDYFPETRVGKMASFSEGVLAETYFLRIY